MNSFFEAFRKKIVAIKQGLGKIAFWFKFFATALKLLNQNQEKALGEMLGKLSHPGKDWSWTFAEDFYKWAAELEFVAENRSLQKRILRGCLSYGLFRTYLDLEENSFEKKVSQKKLKRFAKIAAENGFNLEAAHIYFRLKEWDNARACMTKEIALIHP